MNTKKVFGENIRRYLDRRNMTNADLAKKVGVSKTMVGNWISGEKGTTFEHLDEIAAVFNVDPIKLLTPPNKWRSDNDDFEFGALMKNNAEARYVMNQMKVMSESELMLLKIVLKDVMDYKNRIFD